MRKHILLASIIGVLFVACTKDNDEGLSGSKVSFSVENISSTFSPNGLIDNRLISVIPTGKEGLYVKVYEKEFSKEEATPFTKNGITTDATFPNAYKRDGFGLYAYRHSATPYTPGEADNLLQLSTVGALSGDKVTSTDGLLWNSTNSLNWGKYHKMSFFGYAPLLGITAKENNGTPSIVYTVPTNMIDQVDLLATAAKDISRPDDFLVPLSFNHTLVPIVFIASSHFQAGRVVAIELNGVKNSGTYNMVTESWSLNNTTANFVATFNKDLPDGADTDINSPNQVMFMLPQLFENEDAMLTVKYKEEGTPTFERTLSVPLKETGNWEMGNKYTYYIGDLVIFRNPVLTTEPLPEITHDGLAATNISVTSTYDVFGGSGAAGDNTATAPVVPYDIQYSTDGGKTWSNTLPDMLSVCERVTTPGADLGKLRIAVKPQAASVFSSTMLGENTDNGAYNLSNESGASTVQNTSNCYVINAPGYYSLPLVYGNAIKNGVPNSASYSGSVFQTHKGHQITDPYIYENFENGVSGAKLSATGAELVWEDSQNLISSVGLSADGKWLRFTAAARQGNAVVAAVDTAGVMWSWHIWATDWKTKTNIAVEDNVITCPSGLSSDVALMTVPIGWCSTSAQGSYVPRSCRVKLIQKNTAKEHVLTIFQGPNIAEGGSSVVYQWGRKDPMPPSLDFRQNVSGYSSNKTIYPNAIGSASASWSWKAYSEASATISYAIRHPNIMLGSLRYIDNWLSFDARNLWNQKYIPASLSDKTMPMEKTVYDPSPVGFSLPNSFAFYNFKSSDSSNYGRIWYGLFYPSLGFRDLEGGSWGNIGGVGAYWTAFPHKPLSGNAQEGRHLQFYSGSSSMAISHTYHCGRAYALPIIAVREE